MSERNSTRDQLASFSLRVEPVENGFVIYELGHGRHPHDTGLRHIAACTADLDRILAVLSRKNIDAMVAQYKPAAETKT